MIYSLYIPTCIRCTKQTFNLLLYNLQSLQFVSGTICMVTHFGLHMDPRVFVPITKFMSHRHAACTNHELALSPLLTYISSQSQTGREERIGGCVLPTST